MKNLKMLVSTLVILGVAGMAGAHVVPSPGDWEVWVNYPDPDGDGRTLLDGRRSAP